MTSLCPLAQSGSQGCNRGLSWNAVILRSIGEESSSNFTRVVAGSSLSSMVIGQELPIIPCHVDIPHGAVHNMVAYFISEQEVMR